MQFLRSVCYNSYWDTSLFNKIFTNPQSQQSYFTLRYLFINHLSWNSLCLYYTGSSLKKYRNYFRQRKNPDISFLLTHSILISGLSCNIPLDAHALIAGASARSFLLGEFLIVHLRPLFGQFEMPLQLLDDALRRSALFQIVSDHRTYPIFPSIFPDTLP